MGMLFDHGLDCATSVVMNIVIARIISVGGGLPALLAIQISTVPFYFLLMEEYYTGILELPMLIGPDDAGVAVSVVAWLTAYMGSEWWLEQVEVPFGIAEFLG